MPLPLLWIDSLFARLAVRYGVAWVRMWDGVDVMLVKADWARELGSLQVHPDAIAYGLDHLPADRPPTVTQFLALCIARPEARRALPEPPADPALAAAVLEGIKRPIAADPKAWAYRLKECEEEHDGRLENGRRMTKTQRDMWRAALGRGAPQQEEDHDPR